MGRKFGFLTLLLAFIYFLIFSLVGNSGTRGINYLMNNDTSFNLDPEKNSHLLNSTIFSSCDISRNNCDAITPDPNTDFIADGAYNSTDSTLFFVSVVPGGGGVFQLDPATCSVVSGTYYPVSPPGPWNDRALAFDLNRYQIWVGGWSDYLLHQHDATPPYSLISENFVGPIASAAVDPLNDYLFIGTNANPDMLYVYDISSGGLGDMLGSWAVPWQSESDGFDMAGMAFDDDSGQLILINQYTNGPHMAREAFNFDLINGLTGAGYCSLDYTGQSWGIGLIEDGDPEPGTFLSYVPDIYNAEPPFNIDEYGIPAVYPPYGLVCTVTSDRDVELTWSNGESYDEVYVYRDYDLIEVLPGSATYYLDTFPGYGFYNYGLVGVVGDEESGQVQCRVLITPQGKVCFNFNETDDGWSPGGLASWEWGEPSYVLDGNAWETNLGGNYANASCGWLDSPEITLGSEGCWLTIDSFNYVDCGGDGWNVQMSTDGGESWSIIYPYEGYDQGDPAADCDEGLDGETNCGYFEIETWDFDLTDHPDAHISIRFLFEANYQTAYVGLIVDRVCFYGGSMPVRGHREAVPKP